MSVVAAPDDSAPLSQGDILRNVPFAVTSSRGELASDAKSQFVLVVSRPCIAVRQSAVTVAPVIKMPIDLTGLSAAKHDGSPSLDRMRRILSGIRDGGQMSDSFYLGTLVDDGANTRYAAQLSTLSTIQVPTAHDERATWVKQNRVWRLQEDFVKDLHVRLFVSFARLGFDDYAWFADVDLDVLITAGQKELNALRDALNDAEIAVQKSEAQNQKVSEIQKSAIVQKRAAISEAEKQLEPYVKERERRRFRVAQ